ncbi:LptF/LptG family permease [Meiothermus ruber]|jgi:lipopolysaccharide export LptBFGC system permease protein LptF|uniref:Permease YjgP/YjgQ family protein n=1 Tax=Meiothermus ruber (strain ATCC 35948 / DSM 1279 / VKM B-1258 / 21) TaxID=504728 RepID=D3PLK4_MEIRD|nr:LptF/LptG family permease [Meiothermus ruber]ADD29095.1 permease YjgP/YjgQ family protein [Meiothermus ruber DSM 1279]AGK05454.1 YjgP/YjgQ family permease [Meiothermus ruber DSM 1279]MCL6528572.1 LptF/LptG family permease [Meiothermus ruber]
MLPRYLLRETLSLYLLGVLLFVGLITFDLLSSLSGAFLRARTPVGEIVQMVAYRVPHTLGIALPLGLVFALLVALARWIRQSELKAAYAAGIPPRVFIGPVLLLALAVGAVVLLNEGWLKPIAQERFEALQYKIYYGSEPSGVLTERTYTPQGLGIYYAQRIYPPPEGQTGSRLEGVRVVESGGSVWSAERGVWVSGAWRLQNAYRVDPSGQIFQEAEHPLPFPVGVQPKAVSYEALRMPELHAVASADPAAQFPLARRYANAVGTVVLAWLAIVIGLSLRESAWAFIAVVGLIFGYWTLFTLSAQFARFDLLGAYGAWLPNIVYGGLALLGTWRLAR